MATKLILFNTALRYCKSRKLSSLTEDRKPRHLLDDVWAAGGVDRCLEEAQWKFATRSVKLDYDASITREYGFLRGFTKPTDWVKTVAMCSDEYFKEPLTHYHHDGNEWYSDLDAIYVRYVSNHADWGSDLSSWPAAFLNYVAAHFANEIVDDLTGDQKTIERVMQVLDKNEKEAKSLDAWNQPTAFPASGNWSRSRRRGSRSRSDLGNRGSLLG
jgi:hypothetical protein